MTTTLQRADEALVASRMASATSPVLHRSTHTPHGDDVSPLRHHRGARTLPLLAVLALTLSAPSARAEDDGLETLIDQALQARPELAQAQAELRVAEERVPRAQAWPDPMLQVGVQNDGFDRWRVGTMETSWVAFMASQTIPFPGKPGLRAQLAQVDVTTRKLALERARLSTIADVRRAHLSLQLIRARLELLARLERELTQAADTAQARYAAGAGAQPDLWRARLELARLAQRRVLLEGDEALQVAALNRLRARPLDEAVRTPPLLTLAFPAAPDTTAATQRALDESPEVMAARAAVQAAAQALELSRRQVLPDVTLGAGVMARGPLAPMWTLSVGVPIPISSGLTRGHALAEGDAALDAARRGVDAVEQLARLRTSQRLAAWRALARAWQTSQERVLADADAAAGATLTAYRAGTGSFDAVLDANATVLSLTDASYGVLADAWRLAIAQDELSLALAEVNAGAWVATPAASSIAATTGGM